MERAVAPGWDLSAGRRIRLRLAERGRRPACAERRTAKALPQPTTNGALTSTIDGVSRPAHQPATDQARKLERHLR